MQIALSSLREPSQRPVAPIGRLAVRSLHTELALSPKPGLVSPLDSGSHADMDASTFMRSIFSLRSYFGDITSAGASGTSFLQLKSLGIVAEARMLDATGGINTHRGAIFSLGLLAAGAAWLAHRGLSLSGPRIGQTVARLWGDDIVSATPHPGRSRSHGSVMARRYGAGGARLEAALGFPTLFRIGVPTLHATLKHTGNMRLALVQTLFSLMAALNDTNVLYRGGRPGLRMIKDRARTFLRAGGVYRPDWESHALDVHRQVVCLGLSPGGSADLLAASWFVVEAQRY
jgi:triphosphoribosyl-dephospho-CoA synthase